MLTVLVPGGLGQLGWDLARAAALAAPGEVELIQSGSAELDITDAGAVAVAVKELSEWAAEAGSTPLVINAAAYTAVDAAETNEERAFAVNMDGPQRLAAACHPLAIPLIHVSTDYVFAGDANRPYEPGAPIRPRSVYGRSKAAGKEAVLTTAVRSWVVRTAWVYGKNGGNFVKTMLQMERQRETVSVVDDQRGSPTWSADLASGLLELARFIAKGDVPNQWVLQCTGAGETTWYGFARAIFEELGADPERVKPCSTAEFPLPAPRPVYSVLSNDAWRSVGLTPLRHWREALHTYLAEEP